MYIDAFLVHCCVRITRCIYEPHILHMYIYYEYVAVSLRHLIECATYSFNRLRSQVTTGSFLFDCDLRDDLRHRAPESLCQLCEYEQA